MGSSPQLTHALLNDRVKQAFSTSEGDLEANRAGRMTPAQEERMAKQRTSQLLSMCLGGVAMIIMVTLSLAGAGKGADPRPSSKGVDIVMLCVIGGMGLFGLGSLAMMTDDIHASQVLSLQGSVNRGRVDRKVRTYRLFSQQKSFEMPDTTYDAFVDGEVYILYYTPKSQTLIGAEHVQPIESD